MLVIIQNKRSPRVPPESKWFTTWSTTNIGTGSLSATGPIVLGLQREIPADADWWGWTTADIGTGSLSATGPIVLGLQREIPADADWWGWTTADIGV